MTPAFRHGAQVPALPTDHVLRLTDFQSRIAIAAVPLKDAWLFASATALTALLTMLVKQDPGANAGPNRKVG